MPDDVSGPKPMEESASPGTLSVGAGLREVRERLGWRLTDVAESLRMRPEFLEAIEAGNLAILPGPAYRTGFVRSYARTLGLDPDEILRRFRTEGALPDTIAKTETRFITNVPDSGVPKGAAVMVGVVLLLAGYGLWYHYSGTQRRLAEQVPAVPAELAPLATPPRIVAPVNPAPAPPVVNTSTPPAPAPATALPPGTRPPAAATTAPVPTPALAVPGVGMVISATQDAWVEVHDPAGNILFSKVLHPGESWPVPQEAGLTLTTGNAGGTVVTNNGVAGAPLGEVGTVLHSYQLTPPAPGSPAATTIAAPSAPATAKSVTPAPAGGAAQNSAAPGGTP